MLADFRTKLVAGGLGAVVGVGDVFDAVIELAVGAAEDLLAEVEAALCEGDAQGVAGFAAGFGRALACAVGFVAAAVVDFAAGLAATGFTIAVLADLAATDLTTGEAGHGEQR